MELDSSREGCEGKICHAKKSSIGDSLGLYTSLVCTIDEVALGILFHNFILKSHLGLQMAFNRWAKKKMPRELDSALTVS